MKKKDDGAKQVVFLAEKDIRDALAEAKKRSRMSKSDYIRLAVIAALVTDGIMKD